MGNKLKHEIKALTYHEVGVKLDDQLEIAEREQSELAGARTAFTAAKTAVEGLTANIDKDIKEGTLSMEEGDLAKRWVLRGAAILQNLGIQAEVQKYQAQGKVIALRQVVKVAKSLYDSEKQSLDEAVKLEEGTAEEIDPRRPDARALGQHPGNPLANRRDEASEAPETSEDEAPLSEPPPAGRSTSRPPPAKGKKPRR